MKTGNEARLFLGMTASGWAAGGVGQQRRLLDSAGGEGGWGILGLLSFPLAVMLPSSARREDLTAGLPRGFPGRSSTDTGRSRMPTGSCGQEDRLTRGASENPTMRLASKACKACVQGPCCSLAPLRDEIVKVTAFLFSFHLHL